MVSGAIFSIHDTKMSKISTKSDDSSINRPERTFMTETEKKLLQAKHRLEEAQARDRVKQRKTRTRRLIQEGAVLEKTLPQTMNMDLNELEMYLHNLTN